jgi:hypothetical protein
MVISSYISSYRAVKKNIAIAILLDTVNLRCLLKKKKNYVNCLVSTYILLFINCNRLTTSKICESHCFIDCITLTNQLIVNLSKVYRLTQPATAQLPGCPAPSCCGYQRLVLTSRPRRSPAHAGRRI